MTLGREVEVTKNDNKSKVSFMEGKRSSSSNIDNEDITM